MQEHVAKLLKYNLDDTKMLRGSQCIHIATLVKKQEPQKVDKVAALIPEFIRANFNIRIDFFTGRKVRYQKPSWPQLPEIGLLTANEVLIVQWAMFHMAQLAFKDLPCYHELMEYIQNTTRVTSYGQFADEYFARERLEFPVDGSNIDWNQFTKDNLLKIINNTAAIDAAPCRLALYLAGLKGTKYIEQADAIAIQMGLLDRISAEFVDAFFDRETMSVPDENMPDDVDGESIRRGKLTFLAIKALEKAKGEERKVLFDNYGRDEDECVASIKKLYKQLGLFEVYSHKQSEIAGKVLKMIHEWDEKGSNIPKDIFPCLSSSIYANGANLSAT